jgi:DNA-directed RNA polymerase subunit RPC12/RpoP
LTVLAQPNAAGVAAGKKPNPRRLSASVSRKEEGRIVMGIGAILGLVFLWGVISFIVAGIPLIIMSKRYKRAAVIGLKPYLLGVLIPLIIMIVLIIFTEPIENALGNDILGFASLVLALVLLVFDVVGLVKSGAAYKKRMKEAGADWDGQACPYCGSPKFKTIGEETPEWVKAAAQGVGFSKSVTDLAESAKEAAQSAKSYVTFKCEKCKSKWIIPKPEG